jgi:Zn-dependent protease with chaperone function
VTEAAPAAHRPGARLNPFAFPSDTTFRFLLLIVSVVGVSLFLFNWTYFNVADTRREAVEALACLQQNETALRSARSPADLARTAEAAQRCHSVTNRTRGTFILGGVATLLLTATALYIAAPWWKLRRRRLIPFTAEDDPDVAAELDALSRTSGLEETPQFVWNPLDPVPTGLAFGRVGRRYVALSGGLVTRYYTDRPAFRAVVLHELAHLRNRDVDKTYFTVALWYAFLLVAVLPFLPTLLDEHWDAAASLGWRLAVLTGFVYFTRNAVLRAREVYADVRASVNESPPGGLRRVLVSLAERPRRLRDRLLGVHPDPAARARALDETGPLFSLTLLEAFAAGIAATIAYHEVVTVISFYNSGWTSTYWWSALAFAPLAVGVVGFGAWRAAFARLTRGQGSGDAWRLGVALGAGFIVGERLSFSTFFGVEDTILSADWSNVVWALIVLAGLGLFVAWMASAAALWLPVAGQRSPRWTSVVALGAGGLVLTIAMGIFFQVRSTRAAIDFSTALTAQEHDAIDLVTWAGPEWVYQFVRDPMIATFVHRPVVWPAIAALWAFPLAALLLRRRAGRPLPWASLDARDSIALSQPRLRIGRALAVGLAGAAVVLVGMLLLRAALRYGVSEATRGRDEFILAFYVWTVSLGLLAQTVVAAVTAAVCRRGAIVLALLGSTLTGAAGAVTVFAYPTIAGCVDVVALRNGPCEWAIDAGFTRQAFEQVIAQGTLVALIGAVAGAGVAWGVRRWREAHEPGLSPAGASS